jgi:hypothetical protein
MTNKTVGTETGILLEKYLEKVCDSTDIYKNHVGIDLLSALNYLKVTYQNNEYIVRQGALDFFEDYEKGIPSSEPKRADNAWNIYTIMMGGSL